MSSKNKPSPHARELVDLVAEIRTAAPDMLLQHAIPLAIAAQQAAMFDDAVIVLGDIADALNDMRPAPPPDKVH